MSELIDQLKQQAHLWQGREQAIPCRQGMATGYPGLDRHLSGQGWPQGALTEILLAAPGIGELRLVMPMLQRLTRAGQTVVWVSPPYTPYAPALARAGVVLDNLIIVRCENAKDQLWALEQALRNPACALVMGWPAQLRQADTRRLQLAAEAGGGPGILFRSTGSSLNSSPAHLRLLLSASAGALHIELLKQRGSFAQSSLTLPLGTQETLVEPDQASASNIIQGPWQAASPLPGARPFRAFPTAT